MAGKCIDENMQIFKSKLFREASLICLQYRSVEGWRRDNMGCGRHIMESDVILQAVLFSHIKIFSVTKSEF